MVWEPAPRRGHQCLDDDLGGELSGEMVAARNGMHLETEAVERTEPNEGSAEVILTLLGPFLDRNMEHGFWNLPMSARSSSGGHKECRSLWKVLSASRVGWILMIFKWYKQQFHLIGPTLTRLLTSRSSSSSSSATFTLSVRHTLDLLQAASDLAWMAAHRLLVFTSLFSIHWTYFRQTHTCEERVPFAGSIGSSLSALWPLVAVKNSELLFKDFCCFF